MLPRKKDSTEGYALAQKVVARSSNLSKYQYQASIAIGQPDERLNSFWVFCLEKVTIASGLFFCQVMSLLVISTIQVDISIFEISTFLNFVTVSLTLVAIMLRHFKHGLNNNNNNYNDPK